MKKVCDMEEIVLFKSTDGEVSLPVSTDGDTVWLSQAQMAELFGKDQSVISRHIKNALSDGEIDISANYAKFAYPAENASKIKEIDVYDLDLVALTVMIAESRPEEKEMMVNLVMTFLK